MTVQWCDPPPMNCRANGWHMRLYPVMARPGYWALVRELNEQAARTAIRDLRRGRLQTPPGCWEFRVGRTGSGFGVWAKYIGPEA